MKALSSLFVVLALVITLPACATNAPTVANVTPGVVITDMKAHARGGASPFDGVVDSVDDLEDLVISAWGVDWLGSHRGHRPIQSVLEAFLGISHDQMHFYMEEKNLNLASVCEELGFDPEKLIQALTNSYSPYIDDAVARGVITANEATVWNTRVREQFKRRVYWQG